MKNMHIILLMLALATSSTGYIEAMSDQERSLNLVCNDGKKIAVPYDLLIQGRAFLKFFSDATGDIDEKTNHVKTSEREFVTKLKKLGDIFVCFDLETTRTLVSSLLVTRIIDRKKEKSSDDAVVHAYAIILMNFLSPESIEKLSEIAEFYGFSVLSSTIKKTKLYPGLLEKLGPALESYDPRMLGMTVSWCILIDNYLKRKLNNHEIILHVSAMMDGMNGKELQAIFTIANDHGFQLLQAAAKLQWDWQVMKRNKSMNIYDRGRGGR